MNDDLEGLIDRDSFHFGFPMWILFPDDNTSFLATYGQEGPAVTVFPLFTDKGLAEGFLVEAERLLGTKIASAPREYEDAQSLHRVLTSFKPQGVSHVVFDPYRFGMRTHMPTIDSVLEVLEKD